VIVLLIIGLGYAIFGGSWWSLILSIPISLSVLAAWMRWRVERKTVEEMRRSRY
jgi:membrane protein implicated in regulation of membrane protease activity